MSRVQWHTASLTRYLVSRMMRLRHRSSNMETDTKKSHTSGGDDTTLSCEQREEEDEPASAIVGEGEAGSSAVMKGTDIEASLRPLPLCEIYGRHGEVSNADSSSMAEYISIQGEIFVGYAFNLHHKLHTCGYMGISVECHGCVK